ncbi:hypothetical protein Tco_0862587, partial [Tanacetum coccineum]
MRANELYKFSNGTLKKVQDELHHRVLDFDLGYNKEMSRRKCTATDKRRSKLMVELIDKQIRERRIIQNLKRFVGALELEMNYKLMTRNNEYDSYAKAVLGNKSVDMSGKYGTSNAGAESVGVSDCNKVYKEAGNEAVMSISVDDCIDLDG